MALSLNDAELAICVNDPDAWHSESRAEQCEAAMICRTRCPVLAACYEANKHEEWGVWGGTTAVERRKRRRDKTL